MTSCDSYYWLNNQYFQSGFYTDTLTSVLLCDSVVHLDLVISNTQTQTFTFNSCNSFNWNNNTYNQSGQYTDTLQSISGCDSIIILDLVISNTQYTQDSVIECHSYLWNGNNLNSSGTYFDTIQSSYGCDSIVTLDLIILGNTYSYDTVSSCGPYSWNNNVLTQNGLFYDTLQTTAGCDSILILLLETFPKYYDTTFASVCDSFVWNGNVYTTGGIYVDSLVTTIGCDSIQVLNLSFNNSSTSPISLQLVLDDYCAETHWSIKNSFGTIIHQEGPYNCNVSGSGLQANDTILKSLQLSEQACYTFTLYDYFGDGLGASMWGGTDGSWLINDYNGITLIDGQGNFGDSISVSFYVNEDLSTNILETNFNNQFEIVAFPNPFIGETEIRILNFNEIYDISLYDIQGKIVHKIENINQDRFILNSGNISSGVYWLMVNNHPEIKPLKLIVK
jgi:hypothetical protein